MEFLPSVEEALHNLLAAKLRSILAILGVLVGTASVVAMVSCGQLATTQALKQFETLGTDLLSVALYANDSGSRTNQKEHFNLATAMNVKRISSDITAVSPYSTLYLPLTYHGKELHGSIIGATQNLQNTIKITVAKGRFISDLDDYSYYCLIGADLYTQMQKISFGNPIGQQLWLGNNIYTIIGIADKWPENSFFNENINNSVIIPLKTAGVLSNYATINDLIVTLRKDAPIDTVQATIKHYIDGQVAGMNVFFRSAKELIKRMAAQSQIFTLMLGMIGSISLFVGGIGIMNIMLVSVTERKKEIGIRMAIGARRWDIQTLFLIESVILCLFGGLVGVILGIIASFIIAKFSHWQFFIYLTPPFIGFLVSVLVGVFFGFYPAYKASRLDPIQTIRSE